MLPAGRTPTALVPIGGKYSHTSAVVDAEDLDRVSKFTWGRSSAPRSLTNYARASVNGRQQFLHRFIMNAQPGTEINHIDGNGLNNKKSNLEFVTRSENVRLGNSQRAYDRWKKEEGLQNGLQTATTGSNDDAR